MKMSSWLRKLNLMLVIAMVSTLVTVQLPIAHSAESTTAEKGLTFLTDVVKLDMPNYNVKGGVVDPNLPGPFGSEIVKYVLESNGSKVDVLFIFKDDAYLWCNLNSLEGSPLFTQPSTAAVDEAKSVLERYETFSGASYIQSMHDMLTSMSELKPMSTAVGDIRFDIANDGTITWMNAVNGITNTYDIVALTIRNGTFMQFCDSWNLYKIGSADVKVDQEEAIRIAKENAYIHSGPNGDVKFTDFNVVDEFILTELKMQPRTAGTLYPNWIIRLPLDKVYFSQVTQIDVSIWADTGEVAGVSSGGGYGPSDGENPPTSQSSTSGANSSPPTTTYLIAGVVATTVAIAAIAVVLKKRRK